MVGGMQISGRDTPASLRRDQLAAAKSSLLWVGVSAASLLAAVFVAYWLADVRPMLLLADPNAVSGAPWYTGALSQAGGTLWAVAATAALLAAGMLATEDAELRHGLQVFGWLSLALMTDDLLMIHERALREIGLPELALVGPYVVVVLAAVWRFAPRLRHLPDILTLMLALALFGASVGLDIGHDLGFSVRGRATVEELCKLLGLVCWARFAIRTFLHVFRTQSSTGEGEADGAGAASKLAWN